MEKTTASLVDTQAVFSERSRFGSQRSKVAASARQREAELLKPAIGFDDCPECDKLIERIAQVERDQRCVQRAASLMAGLTVLATVGFGYGLVLQENFPHGTFRFAAWLIAALGLTSLISLVTFAGLWLSVRRKLNGLLQECRQLVMELVKFRRSELSCEALAARAGAAESNPIPNRSAPADRAPLEKAGSPTQ